MADEAEIVWESLQDAARKAGQEAAEASAAEQSAQEKTQGFCENDVSAETPDPDAELPDPYLEPGKALEHERELREDKPDAFERSGKARLPDALVWLCEKSLEGRLDTSKGAEMYEILIHLERDALEPNGFKAQLADGTALSADAFRRIACDASLVPALVDERGNVLDIGRKTRTIPPAIRRALDMRDRKCCFPGCHNRRWLHAHHIEAWAHGGDTKLDNLCLLCTYHHQLVHERGYGVKRLPDGDVAFYYPSGVRVQRHPNRARAPLDPHRELVAMQPDVTPRDVPAWDGSTPDYGACVGALG